MAAFQVFMYGRFWVFAEANSRGEHKLLQPDLSFIYCLVTTVIEAIPIRFQRRHFDGFADVLPRSDRELVLELFA